MPKPAPGEHFQPNQFMNFVHRETTEVFSVFHSHQGMEFLFIHEGSGHVIIDHKLYPVENDTLIFLQPFQIHKVYIESKYKRSVFFVNPVGAEPYLTPFPELYLFFRKLLKVELPAQVFYLQKDNLLQKLIHDFRQSLRNGEHTSQEDYAIFFLQLLKIIRKWISNLHPDDLPATTRSQHHVEKMLDWLEMHFREPFSLQELADSVFLSPYHASRLFKKHTGSTMTSYLMARRIKEAAAIIATTNISVKEVSRRVGFQGDAYFCKQFKQLTGLSPSEYRLQIENELISPKWIE
ncbi:AraC family transcriptional regulator [Paenibacillus sp. GD4]|jgi:AraC-like DNA-binding protein|uniref:AraC family transcriptional regulator n=1 Tax=Paenibacillus sp. GD4 TaxID=3068890 RepID=UPI002796CBAC|nr:AraC family transcriptional regulator [Paenibacillus sp. GD4]MDQ1914604.1 AraC family transcriptional regulator [Paenibacillus sp. GD4]